MAAPVRRLLRPTLFICDIQDKFRPAIYEFPRVIATAQKALQAARILSIPVVVTTQLRAKLGETCTELALQGPDAVVTPWIDVDKSKFSMWTDDVQAAFSSDGASGEAPRQVAIVGIESHICVTQTTLDLLRAGHQVYVLADGVSSCNREEVPMALARLRAAGAVVTTSESWLYEVMGDANIDEFRAAARLVKEWSARTKEGLQALCGIGP